MPVKYICIENRDFVIYKFYQIRCFPISLVTERKVWRYPIPFEANSKLQAAFFNLSKTVYEKLKCALKFRPSLATSPYRASILAGLLGYIPYTHIAAVCMFELVVLFLLTICGDPYEYITYELVPASPAVFCMSCSSNLDSFCYGRQMSLFWCNCRLASPAVLLASK